MKSQHTRGPSLGPRTRHLSGAVLAAVALLGAPAGQSQDLRLAPLVEVTGEEAGVPNGWRALGPFFEDTTTGAAGESQTAFLRPLLSTYEDDEDGRAGRDLLWPLGVTRRQRLSSHQRLLLALHTDPDVTDGDGPERWWLMPFVFHGRSRQGEPYFGFFPFGGAVADIAGYDEVRFWAFPLYWGTTHTATTRSSTWLWPVFSRTEGPQIHKWRVFPVVGESRTDRETRRFYLWPLGHTIERAANARGETGSGTFVLPLGGRYTQKDAAGQPLFRSWALLWPFFSGDSGPAGDRLCCPWPFVQIQRQKTASGKESKTYVWPAYGQAEGHTEDYRFLAWPFVQDWWSGDQANRKTRRWVLPVYWSATECRDGQSTASYRHLWPLVRRDRDGDRVRVEALALWPQHHAAAMERNYAPLWTLYSYDRQADRRRHECLWGLWQSESTPDSRRRALFPLFDYRRGQDGYRVSLLTGLAGWGKANGQTQARALWVVEW